MAPKRSRRPKRRIPEATVARLPLYLRSLVGVAEEGVATISSERLAELSAVNAAKVRKDLSYLGSYGTRGVGYDVEYLLFQMSRELGLTNDWRVVIAGIGNLGHALANYGGFGARGFPVAALVDIDTKVVGTTVNGIEVEHLDDLASIVQRDHIAIGIIATPAHVAQEVADRLVEAGVTSVLNFAPTILTVPEGVSVRKVDLAVELQILSFYQQRKMAEAVSGDGPSGRPGTPARSPGAANAAGNPPDAGDHRASGNGNPGRPSEDPAGGDGKVPSG